MGTVTITTLPILGRDYNPLNAELVTDIQRADHDALVEAGRRYQTTTRAKTRRVIENALATIGWTVADAKAYYAQAAKEEGVATEAAATKAPVRKATSQALTPEEAVRLHRWAKRNGNLSSQSREYKARIHHIVRTRA